MHNPKTKGESKASKTKGPTVKEQKVGRKWLWREGQSLPTCFQTYKQALQVRRQLQHPGEAFPTRLPQPNILTTLRKEPTIQLVIYCNILPSLLSGESQSRHYIHLLVELFYTSHNYIIFQRKKIYLLF